MFIKKERMQTKKNRRASKKSTSSVPNILDLTEEKNLKVGETQYEGGFRVPNYEQYF